MSRGLAELSEHLDEVQPWRKGPWQHPDSEPERLLELQGLLAKDFVTPLEVRVRFVVAGLSHVGRVDLLAIPRECGIEGLDEIALAFEVKRKGFDVERALKQSADYVGGTVFDGPHAGKRIAACFLYPTTDLHDSPRYGGMFNLIAQWRVGRGYFDRYHEFKLDIGIETVWRSRRGWGATRAKRMLLGQRTVGGSRRDIDQRPELIEEEGMGDGEG
jgi:hypothetical protein